MKTLLLLLGLSLLFASCTTDELQCGTVMNKKIIYGKEYENKDMPIGYTITTEYGTYQVSESEYNSVSYSETYCK